MVIMSNQGINFNIAPNTSFNTSFTPAGHNQLATNTNITYNHQITPSTNAFVTSSYNKNFTNGSSSSYVGAGFRFRF